MPVPHLAIHHQSTQRHTETMKPIVVPLLIASTLMAQTPASLSDSPFASGNSFLHSCSVMDKENYDSVETASLNACLGYIYGFVDGTTVQLVMGDHGKAVPNASFC